MVRNFRITSLSKVHSCDHALRGLLRCVFISAQNISSPVGEESFIHLEQGLFVVDEQIQQVVFIFLAEVDEANSVLGQLGEPQQRFFKVFRFLQCLVNLVELLVRVNLVLKSAPHDLLPHFLNALDKELLEVVALDAGIRGLADGFALCRSLSVYYVFEGADQLVVIRFQRLHVLDDLVLHVDGGLLRLEDVADELLELRIARGNLLVLAAHRHLGRRGVISALSNLLQARLQRQARHLRLKEGGLLSGLRCLHMRKLVLSVLYRLVNAHRLDVTRRRVIHLHNFLAALQSLLLNRRYESFLTVEADFAARKLAAVDDPNCAGNGWLLALEDGVFLIDFVLQARNGKLKQLIFTFSFEDLIL